MREARSSLVAATGPLAAATEFPQESGFDQSRALLAEGYRWMGNRFQRHGSDVFQATLMMRRATCVMGEDAARMFYEPNRFTRRGALPPSTTMLLQDYGSVMTKDGPAHQARKQMFMSLMTPPQMERLYRIAEAAWRARQQRWVAMERVVLHDEAQAILCRAACEWAGLDLSEEELDARTEEFAAMVDGAATIGPRNWRGMILRSRTERWAAALIEDVRAGRAHAPAESALHLIAAHRDADGRELSADTAAVELINLLRPTQAIARYIAFGALALHQHPQYRAALVEGGAAALPFVHELRRFYPFIPAMGGVALHPFEWRGRQFAVGDWVLLDLYGTCHDPRLWQQPNRFRPQRFEGWQGNPYTLIPQGGGDHLSNHRCPGEWITIGLLCTLLGRYAAMRCEVPRQNMWIDLCRMPALPASGFVISRVTDA
jgi:fatty-acid peroxygenase